MSHFLNHDFTGKAEGYFGRGFVVIHHIADVIVLYVGIFA